MSSIYICPFGYISDKIYRLYIILLILSTDNICTIPNIVVLSVGIFIIKPYKLPKRPECTSTMYYDASVYVRGGRASAHGISWCQSLMNARSLRSDLLQGTATKELVVFSRRHIDCALDQINVLLKCDVHDLVARPHKRQRLTERRAVRALVVRYRCRVPRRESRHCDRDCLLQIAHVSWLQALAMRRRALADARADALEEREEVLEPILRFAWCSARVNLPCEAKTRCREELPRPIRRIRCCALGWDYASCCCCSGQFLQQLAETSASASDRTRT